MIMKEIVVAPSLLSADFMDLNRQIDMISRSGAQWLHCDVMDGIFVPNISIGIPVIASVRKKSNIIMDVHLMITEPIRYIKEFRKAGADIITFHIESCHNISETIDEIKSSGSKAGISIKPRTPIEDVYKFINNVDLVLVMTVEPGFGGQKFMPDMMDKVKNIRKYIDNNSLDVYLQVDGGIDAETIKTAARAGADSFVAGTSVFNAADVGAAVVELKSIAKQYA